MYLRVLTISMYGGLNSLIYFHPNLVAVFTYCMVIISKPIVCLLRTIVTSDGVTCSYNPLVSGYCVITHSSSSHSYSSSHLLQQSVHRPLVLQKFSTYCSHVSHCDGPYGALTILPHIHDIGCMIYSIYI